MTANRPYLSSNEMRHLVPGVLDSAAIDFFVNGHCASMALALHELTGWQLISLMPRYALRKAGYWGHAAVNSSLGLLDARGLFTAEEWLRGQDLEWDDINYAKVHDLPYARKNLELVIPFATALLDKHFQEGWRLSQPHAL